MLVVLGNDGLLRVWAVVEAAAGPTSLHGTWDQGGVVDMALCPADPTRPSDSGDVCVWLAVVVDRPGGSGTAPVGRPGGAVVVVKVALRGGGATPGAPAFSLHFVTESEQGLGGPPLAHWAQLTARRPSASTRSMRMVRTCVRDGLVAGSPPPHPPPPPTFFSLLPSTHPRQCGVPRVCV